MALELTLLLLAASVLGVVAFRFGNRGRSGDYLPGSRS